MAVKLREALADGLQDQEASTTVFKHNLSGVTDKSGILIAKRCNRLGWCTWEMLHIPGVIQISAVKYHISVSRHQWNYVNINGMYRNINQNHKSRELL